MNARRRRSPSSEKENYSTDVNGGVFTTVTKSAFVTDSDMTCRDRTHEFRAVVKSLQSRQDNSLSDSSSRNNRQQLITYREFSRFAKNIGKDISNTYAKLEKLTILAKRKSLFDDKPIEIQELTYIIKQDINSLNKQIGQLQQLVKQQGDRNGRHIQSHSNTVVVSLQSKLASMSNNFKQVLEVRTQNLKEQKSRREQFSQSAALSTGNTSSVFLQEENNGRGDVAINMDGFDTQHHSQLQLVNEDDAYIQSRANTMENIESTIVELGGIFQQLATMVKEQEEQVQRIDANVQDTEMNVEAAHGEILKYFQSVTSNRWLMVKVFLVLIVFFIIFVVFFA